MAHKYEYNEVQQRLASEALASIQGKTKIWLEAEKATGQLHYDSEALAAEARTVITAIINAMPDEVSFRPEDVVADFDPSRQSIAYDIMKRLCRAQSGNADRRQLMHVDGVKYVWLPAD